MIFTETSLAGVTRIDLEKRCDERGFFARSFCADEFAAHGLPTEFVQQNTSFSVTRGTLRGMHYQIAPNAEDKLVRCLRGALFDVALDLRPESPTYLKWQGFELSAENRTQILIPKGVAHGFQTLQDETEICYLVSSRYAPEAERGIRWNDPATGIDWPLEPTVMSDKDRNWPDLDPS